MLLPILLSANLTYSSNYNKEVDILRSLDIESSFLYDPIMNKMKDKNTYQADGKLFFKAMDDAYIFIPTIKKILVKYDVPQEFLYLAMAESNFKLKAYSKKRAVGLWQFMPSTAKLFHLKIDKYVDERRDLVKSTQAAAKYLAYLHKRFGKWYLAAIAYNCGEGRLFRAIKKAKSDELSVLLNRHKRYIPKESRFYIRKIVALAMIGNDEDFLLKSEYQYLLNRASAYSVATVKVKKGDSLSRISKLIGIPLKELKQLNRQLKYSFIPPYTNDYDIYIPYVSLASFKQKYHPSDIQKIYKIYRVKSGDNLLKIGKRYGVKYRMIMDFNNLKSSRLSLKQKLIIPIVTKKHKKLRYRSKIVYYKVKKGDTLLSISKQYNIKIATIKSNNSLHSNIIKIGDRLKIYE